MSKEASDGAFGENVEAPGRFFYRVSLRGEMGKIDERFGDVNRALEAEASRIHVPMLPPLAIPANKGDYLDVFVSHVELVLDKENYLRMFVQLRNHSKKLADLSDSMSKAYGHLRAQDLMCYNPDRGQIVAAKYSLDECWYRAVVIQRNGMSNFKVFFVDYGNVSDVNKPNLKLLEDSKLKAIPPQAVNTKLKLSCKPTDSEDVIKKLNNQEICIQIVGIDLPAFECLVVDAFYDDNGKVVSINDAISGRCPWPRMTAAAHDLIPVETNNQQSSTPYRPTSTDQQPNNQSRIMFDKQANVGGPSSMTAGSFSSRNQNSGSRQAQQQDFAPTAQQQRNSGNFHENQNGFASNCRPSERFQGSAPDGAGPRRPVTCFGCSKPGHRKNECPDINNGSGGGFNRSAQYAPRQSNSGGFGGPPQNTFGGASKNSYGGPSQDSRRPDSYSGPRQQSRTFNSTRHNLEPTMNGPERGGFTDNKPSFGGDRPQQHTPRRTEEKPVSWPPAPVPTGQIITVQMSDIEGAKMNQFYLNSSTWTKQLEELEVKPESMPLEGVIEMGTLCVAEYDGDFYRAEVRSVEGPDVTVFFVDYGNCAVKTRFDVFSLDPKTQSHNVLNAHRMAFLAKLEKIEPKDGTEWDPSATEKLKTLVTEGSDYKAIARDKKSTDDIYSVDIFVEIDGKEMSLSEALVEAGLARWIQQRESAKGVTETIAKTEWPEPPVPLNEQIRVQMPDFEGAKMDRMYLTGSPWFHLIDELSVNVESRCLNEPIEVGTLCVAEYGGDFYRGEISAVEGHNLTVFFVDFGNSANKTPQEVFILDPNTQSDNVMKYHRMVFPAVIDGIKPFDATEQWSDAANDKLKELMPECDEFKATVNGKSTDSDVYFVEIYVNSEEKERPISQLMVEAGLARWKHAANACKPQLTVPVQEVSDSAEVSIDAAQKSTAQLETVEIDCEQDANDVPDVEKTDGLSVQENVEGDRATDVTESTVVDTMKEEEMSCHMDNDERTTTEATDFRYSTSDIELGGEALQCIRLVEPNSNPSLFYLLKDFELQRRIEEEIMAGNDIISEETATGAACLAQITKDWCRAQVVQMLPETDEVRVIAVDYGENKVLPRNEVFVLGYQPAIIYETPILMLPCSLYGIEQFEEWSQTALDYFQSLTVDTDGEDDIEEDKYLLVDFVGRRESDGVYTVRVTDQETGSSIAQMLIEAEMARPAASGDIHLSIASPDSSSHTSKETIVERQGDLVIRVSVENEEKEEEEEDKENVIDDDERRRRPLRTSPSSSSSGDVQDVRQLEMDLASVIIEDVTEIDCQKQDEQLDNDSDEREKREKKDSKENSTERNMAVAEDGFAEGDIQETNEADSQQQVGQQLILYEAREIEKC